MSMLLNMQHFNMKPLALSIFDPFPSLEFVIRMHKMDQSFCLFKKVNLSRNIIWYKTALLRQRMQKPFISFTETLQHIKNF